MLRKRLHKDVIWYDFLDPNEEEFGFLAEQNNIDKYIVKKFLTYLNRDKVLLLGDHLFLSLSFPNKDEENYERENIKFIIGRDKIFTSQVIQNEGMARFAKIFESEENFEKDNVNDSHIAFTFLHMIEKIYENAIYELRGVERDIDEIEEDIFKGKEKETVERISLTNRKLIDFKKNLRSHGATWDIFFNLADEYFELEHVKQALQVIILSYKKTIDNSIQLTEFLNELRGTNNSLLQNKRTQINKDFTLIAFLTLPITLFVSIISVPTKQDHFLGTENDFAIVIAFSFILFIASLMVSKYKKWW